MMILALETTAKVASVALLGGETVLGVLYCDAEKKHAETVLPAIEQLLEQQRIGLERIDAFAVDVGPGSFTGVRIGVCIANALAYALHKPVMTVDSLRVLCQTTADQHGEVCALIDARNGNAYAARYGNGICIEAPKAVILEPYLRRLPEDIVFVGDVLPVCQPQAYPDAASLGLAAVACGNDGVGEARPLYLRPSQAERLAGGQK